MKSAISIALAIAALPISAEAASAENITLSRATQSGVVIWKSPTHAKEGNVLQAAGADASLVAPLVACIVDNGTPAVRIRDLGYFKVVMVSGGEEIGCRGVVSRGDIQ